jgi:hypothetical protein
MRRGGGLMRICARISRFIKPRQQFIRFWQLAACCLALWLCASAARADEPVDAAPSGSDAAARAAFLHSFLGYIDWPSQAFKLAGDPFVVGIMNADTVLAEMLLSSTGRMIGNRPVQLKQLREGDKPEGLHLLYIGPTPTDRLSGILAQVAEHWTVVVTDGDNGLALGSAINFREISGRLRFEVSMPVAERSEFRLSSRMLSVAVIRRGGV